MSFLKTDFYHIPNPLKFLFQEGLLIFQRVHISIVWPCPQFLALIMFFNLGSLYSVGRKMLDLKEILSYGFPLMMIYNVHTQRLYLLTSSN